MHLSDWGVLSMSHSDLGSVSQPYTCRGNMVFGLINEHYCLTLLIELVRNLPIDMRTT